MICNIMRLCSLVIQVWIHACRVSIVPGMEDGPSHHHSRASPYLQTPYGVLLPNAMPGTILTRHALVCIGASLHRLRQTHVIERQAVLDLESNDDRTTHAIVAEGERTPLPCE